MRRIVAAAAQSSAGRTKFLWKRAAVCYEAFGRSIGRAAAAVKVR
jgi:hypothetical protein